MKTMMLALLGLLFAAPAFAGDYTNPRVNGTHDWTGFYAGAHVGQGYGNSKDIANPNATAQKPRGVLGGVQVGYDYQTKSGVVLGAVADLTISDMEKKWDGENQFDPYFTKDQIKGYGTVRAKVGYAFDRIKPYVTGGLLVGQVKHSLGCSPSHAPGGTLGCKTPFNTSDTKTRVGWAVGGGVDVAVTENLSVGVEYLHGDLGSYKVHLVDANYPDVERKFKTKFDVIQATLNYRF